MALAACRLPLRRHTQVVVLNGHEELTEECAEQVAAGAVCRPSVEAARISEKIDGGERLLRPVPEPLSGERELPGNGTAAGSIDSSSSAAARPRRCGDSAVRRRQLVHGAGLEKFDESDLFDEPVLRDQVEAHFDGDEQIRKYDDLGDTGPDEYTGVEGKPPGEVLKNGDNANVDQRTFDAQVSAEHPAYATLTEKVNGKTVKTPIKITKVILIVVGQKK